MSRDSVVWHGFSYSQQGLARTFTGTRLHSQLLLFTMEIQEGPECQDFKDNAVQDILSDSGQIAERWAAVFCLLTVAMVTDVFIAWCDRFDFLAVSFALAFLRASEVFNLNRKIIDSFSYHITFIVFTYWGFFDKLRNMFFLNVIISFSCSQIYFTYSENNYYLRDKCCTNPLLSCL